MWSLQITNGICFKILKKGMGKGRKQKGRESGEKYMDEGIGNNIVKQYSVTIIEEDRIVGEVKKIKGDPVSWF
jgi:hypothetical protein